MSVIDQAALRVLMDDAQKHYEAAETCRGLAMRSNAQLANNPLPPPTLLAIIGNGELKYTMLGGANCWRPTVEEAHKAYIEAMRRFVEATRAEVVSQKEMLDKAIAILGDKP